MNNINRIINNKTNTQTNGQSTRLYRMGLVDVDNKPELLGLETLASICSGCLYDDLTQDSALKFYCESIKKFSPSSPNAVFEMLSQTYASINELIPKPIQLLACSKDCLPYFIFSFLENWRLYLVDNGLLEV